ncbi:hypothetical protein T459_19147 [Capsicum annuum]|uniref:Uncharacterized protein n=1 Tax=Capsicum annuum TaxID=4072 RepID=A0A2G2Z176_CAPAN|nr:hypothetical protein T459_19147 [Capsicum annuum]
MRASTSSKVDNPPPNDQNSGNSPRNRAIGQEDAGYSTKESAPSSSRQDETAPEISQDYMVPGVSNHSSVVTRYMQKAILHPKSFRADIVSISLLQDSFHKFSCATGLKANLEKSSIYMEGVIGNLKFDILQSLGYMEGSLPFKYLGVPHSTKKLTIPQCVPLVEKFAARINCCGPTPEKPNLRPDTKPENAPSGDKAAETLNKHLRTRTLKEDKKDKSLDVGSNGSSLFTSATSISELTKKDTCTYMKFRREELESVLPEGLPTGMLKEFNDSMRDDLLIRQSFLDLRDNFRRVVDPTLQSNAKVVKLGITPIMTSGMVMQLLAGSKIIQVYNNVREDQALLNSVQKLLGILVAVGEAVAYVLSGMYGSVSQLGVGNAIRIILQCGVIICL